MVQKLWGFKDFSLASGRLSGTINAANPAQNCPKLPKICPKMKLWNSTKNWDFSIFYKWKFLCIEEALKHVSTVRIFNPRNFCMLFLLSKNGLCMWILVYPLAENDFFLNIPHLLWIWDFEDIYLTQKQEWRGSFHIYFKKWFFKPSKLCCPLRVQGKFYFFSTLNRASVWSRYQKSLSPL
jgi:hypothetical protein